MPKLYNDHPAAVVVRWSLFRGHLCIKSYKWDLKMVVVIDWWSLFEGGPSTGLTVQWLLLQCPCLMLNGITVN